MSHQPFVSLGLFRVNRTQVSLVRIMLYGLQFLISFFISDRKKTKFSMRSIRGKIDQNQEVQCIFSVRKVLQPALALKNKSNQQQGVNTVAMFLHICLLLDVKSTVTFLPIFLPTENQSDQSFTGQTTHNNTHTYIGL